MSDTDENPPSPYWMLQFIVKHGDWLALVTGALPLLAGIAAAYCGLPLVWTLVAGAVGSAFLFIVMRAFVELVRVMVDMLLPR